MSLSSGTKLGPYEVVAPLGSGGMGEVYRARDPRLGREVAIKVLPADRLSDPVRRARFEQEAKAIAALSHPTILAIHDFGEHEGIEYVVTELLEGETLRARLAAGPLPRRKAVEYAAQVAIGLSAAHDKGIVHRDLKPENLFVTTDGQVKILDFGLAAHLDTAVEGQSNLETETRRTGPGTVLGTVGYMSPEQAAGLKADARSDLFSLGCVLYETLSGERAFARDTVPETLTAILREDPPPLADVAPPLPAPLERLVLHCLEKRPEDRFQSARDLAFALQALSGSAISGPGERAPGPGRAIAIGRARWLWPAVTLVAVAVAVATAALVAPARNPAGQADGRRATFLDIALPPGVQLAEPSFARLSGDGRQLVFVGVDQQVRRLWLRSLDSPTTRPLPAAEGGFPVAWSADGRRLAFQSPDGQLKELDVASGALRTLGALPSAGFGDSTGTWSERGDFLVSYGALLHLAPSGSGLVAAIRPEAARGELALDAPQFLADGRRYIFGAVGVTREQSGVYAGVLGSKDRRLLLGSVWLAIFAPPGHLLFQRDTALFAQRFDPDRLELLGEPQLLLDDVYVSTWRHPTAWVSSTTLAFVSGPPRRHQLTWCDRAGRKLGQVGEPIEVSEFDLSADGTRVVAAIGYPGSLWLIDALRGSATRLTRGEEDADPRFRGDAREVLFDRGLEDRSGLYRISLDGGSVVAVLRDPVRPFAHHWSSDGRLVLYSGALGGVWSATTSGGTKPQPVVPSTGVADQARFSPDAHWVAYNGDETGRMEVFVVPFPPTGERWQVSTAGGVQPMWRGNGRELFYLDPVGNLMAADVVLGRSFSAGTPRLLFRSGVESPSSLVEDYGMTADGQRFLFRLPAPGARPPELKVVLDWPALLGKKNGN